MFLSFDFDYPVIWIRDLLTESLMASSVSSYQIRRFYDATVVSTVYFERSLGDSTYGQTP